MHRTQWIAALTVCALVAAPAAADRVLTIKSHTDAMSMMGQTTPAKDETHRYWFGEDAVRYDMGDVSIVTDLENKKLYWIRHADKVYSTLDLPIDFEKLVPPEMAQVMAQMGSMMNATATVRPVGKSGEFAGFSCDYYKTDVSMAMMKISMDSCFSNKVPMDYSKYKDLVVNQSEMFANNSWMAELAKVDGFPVRTDTTTTVMGKSFKGWQELVSAEDQPAPPGTYAAPAGYKEEKFDPMGAGQQRQRR